MAPDQRFTRQRRRGFKNDHSHRAVRTIQFQPTICTEEVVKNTELLQDPGFEKQYADFGNRLDLPERKFVVATGRTEWVWNTGTNVWYPDIVPWAKATNLNIWHLSTTDPRSGTYHILSSQDPIGQSPGPIDCRTRYECEDPNDNWALYSARVDPGDVVNFQCYAKPTVVGTGAWVRLWLQFISITGSTAPGLLTKIVNNTSAAYTLRAFQAVAPPESYWVNAAIRFFNGTGAGMYWQVDDASLIIT
jgi:hypothetical protein